MATHTQRPLRLEDCPSCGKDAEVWYSAGWPYGANKALFCRFCNTMHHAPCPEDEKQFIEVKA